MKRLKILLYSVIVTFILFVAFSFVTNTLRIAVLVDLHRERANVLLEKANWTNSYAQRVIDQASSKTNSPSAEEIFAQLKAYNSQPETIAIQIELAQIEQKTQSYSSSGDTLPDAIVRLMSGYDALNIEVSSLENSLVFPFRSIDSNVLILTTKKAKCDARSGDLRILIQSNEN